TIVFSEIDEAFIMLPADYCDKFFFSSRRRHTRFKCDWSSDVCSSDLLKNVSAIVRADAGQLSAEDRETFFSESLGTVRTLKARSALFAKNEDEIAALAQLEQRFEALQKHGGPPRSSLATGLRGTLLDLQQIQIAKKRSSIFSAGLKKSSSKPYTMSINISQLIHSMLGAATGAAKGQGED